MRITLKQHLGGYRPWTQSSSSAARSTPPRQACCAGSSWSFSGSCSPPRAWRSLGCASRYRLRRERTSELDLVHRLLHRLEALLEHRLLVGGQLDGQDLLDAAAADHHR